MADEETQALDRAQKVGVINPYALAEVVSGRRISWRKVRDKKALLESILQYPYEELFDPKFQGPLYVGLKLNDEGKLERERSPLLSLDIPRNATDLDADTPDPQEIRKLGDLGPVLRVPNIEGVEVRAVSFSGPNVIVTVRKPAQEVLGLLARVLNRDVIRTIAFDPKGEKNKDFTPPNATWGDGGRFFNETAEFFDPIQGAVANCYYIAALSAVAWASPYRIQHMTRATGQAQNQFTNLVKFYKPDSGALDKDIEVTDAVPLTASGGFIYCRSSEAGETWPAIYEKAYAKLETGTSGDHPDIPATAWGDCVWATAQLTGGRRYYYATADLSADELWNRVRQNSLGGRTFNPMTAWTYSSGDEAPKKVSYADGNIVGSHCYTVLGWDYRDGRKYLIVRNPWGSTEATVGVLSGTAFLQDISWWRPISLADPDGTFGIEASAFKTYFAGLGVAK